MVWIPRLTAEQLFQLWFKFIQQQWTLWSQLAGNWRQIILIGFTCFQICVTGHVWDLRLKLAHFALANVRLFLRHMAQHKPILRCSTWRIWWLFIPYTNFLASCWSHHKYVSHVLFCFVCCSRGLFILLIVCFEVAQHCMWAMAACH